MSDVTRYMITSTEAMKLPSCLIGVFRLGGVNQATPPPVQVSATPS